MNPLRVLVVDDTIVYRKIISDILTKIASVEIVDTAVNGKIALEKIAEYKPDLVTLDIEMPKMDGLETLKELRKAPFRPRVIMVSSLTEAGAQITLEALELGAFDFITKPDGVSPESAETFKQQITSKLNVLIRIKVRAEQRKAGTFRTFPTEQKRDQIPPSPAVPGSPIKIVAVGVSTGGPAALAEVIPNLNITIPVVLVQHMPPLFTGALAESLNKKSRAEVQEAQHGQLLKSGHIYIAPGGSQMKVNLKTGNATLEITDDPPENFCKPSVDYLFRSVSEAFGKQCLGVIMTGMGSDGVKGLQEMKAAGATILAQDEATSTVFGMPMVAIKAGVVDKIVPLQEIAGTITRTITS